MTNSDRIFYEIHGYGFASESQQSVYTVNEESIINELRAAVVPLLVIHDMGLS